MSLAHPLRQSSPRCLTDGASRLRRPQLLRSALFRTGGISDFARVPWVSMHNGGTADGPSSRHRGVLIRSFALLCKEFQYVPHACLCLRSLRKESGEAAKVHARIRSGAQDAHRRPGGGFRRPRRVRSFAVLSNWCSVVGDSFLCWNCFRGRYDGFHLAISIISGGLQCRWTMSSSMRKLHLLRECVCSEFFAFRSKLRQGGAA